MTQVGRQANNDLALNFGMLSLPDRLALCGTEWVGESRSPRNVRNVNVG